MAHLDRWAVQLNWAIWAKRFAPTPKLVAEYGLNGAVVRKVFAQLKIRKLPHIVDINKKVIMSIFF